MLNPIIDLSGWQLPQDIDYDVLSNHISGAIIRVFGGSQISKDSNAASSNGVDKSFKTHIKELKKRDVPVAVYSYAQGTSVKEMKEEARIFYKNASPYKPTYYWIDVEEETMSNMDEGKMLRNQQNRLDDVLDKLPKLSLNYQGTAWLNRCLEHKALNCSLGARSPLQVLLIISKVMI